MAEKTRSSNPPLSNFYKSKWFRFPEHLLNTPRYFDSKGADSTLAVPFVRLSHGTSAPALSLTKAGDLWYDQTTHDLRYYDLNQGAWVTLASANNSVSSTGNVTVSGVVQFVNDVKVAAGNTVSATATFTQAGGSNPGKASFKFINSAVADSTITIVAADSTSKTYIAKTDGTVTNGSTAGGNVQFNLGSGSTNALKAKSAANNLKEAIDSVNGHNPPAVAATSTFTFGNIEHDDINSVEAQFQAHNGTSAYTETFRLKNDGTANTAANTFKATADFKFIDTAVDESTITLESASGLTKTYIMKSSGTNGAENGARASFTTSGAGTTNGVLTLTSTDSTTVDYVVKAQGGGVSSGALVASTATLTFTDKPNEGTTITLKDSNGLIRVFEIDDSEDGVSGTNIAVTEIAENGGGGTGTAVDLAAKINAQTDLDITAAAPGSGVLNLTQGTAGRNGNTPITYSHSSWESSISGTAATAFTGGGTAIEAGTNASTFASNIETAVEHANGHGGKIAVTVAGSTKVLLDQATAGPGGNRAITAASSFNDSISGTVPTAFAGGDYIQAVRGSSASDSAAALKAAIENSNGHDGYISVAVDGANVVLTQATPGKEGNTTITTAGTFTTATHPDPGSNAGSKFHGGGVHEFNIGATDEETAANFAEAVQRAFKGDITAVASATTGQVTLTQGTPGATGNVSNTVISSYDLYPAKWNFTFGDTEYDDTEATITLTSTDGTTKTYRSKTSSANASNQEFLAQTSAAVTAQNFKALLESENGHASKATATFTFGDTEYNTVNNASIELEDYLGTKHYFIVKNDGTGSGVGRSFNAETSATVTANNFKEVVEGDSGFGSAGRLTFSANASTSILSFHSRDHNQHNNETITLVSTSGLSRTYTIKNDGSAVAANQEYNAGTTAEQTCENFVNLVNSANGHNGALIATQLQKGGGFQARDFTITQAVAGVAGNTSATCSTNWYKLTKHSTNPAGFFNGADSTISVTTSGGQVTMTQAGVGEEGNTTIVASTLDNEWNSICDVNPPSAFTGGKKRLLVSVDGGAVTVTQSDAGYHGNFALLSLNWGTILDGALGSFSGGFGEAQATFTFGNTEFDDHEDETITLIDGNGVSKTYKIKASGATASNQEFNRGASATACAQAFRNLVNSANGHNGTIKAEANSGTVTLTQKVAGRAGKTIIVRSQNWNALCETTFGSLIQYDQAPPSYFIANNWNDVCDASVGNFTSGVAAANRIKVDVNGSDGTGDLGTVELEQVTLGSAGNTSITISSSPDFDNSSNVASAPAMPAAFTGGTTATSDLNAKTVILTDAAGTAHTMTYSNSTGTSTASTIGIQNLNSEAEIAAKLKDSITLASSAGSLAMTAVDNLDGTLTLTQTGAGTAGNGDKLSGTAESSSLASCTDFAGGSSTSSPYVFFDSTNERLGVGTTSPSAKLEVSGGIKLSGSITFNDGTTQSTAASAGATKYTTTFTLKSSSAIATGNKTSAMFRMPVAATLTNLDIKAGTTGGFTVQLVEAGSFANPTSGSSVLGSITASGTEQSTTSFTDSSVDAGKFLFLNVTDNTSASTDVQVFLTYQTS